MPASDLPFTTTRRGTQRGSEAAGRSDGPSEGGGEASEGNWRREEGGTGVREETGKRGKWIEERG